MIVILFAQVGEGFAMRGPFCSGAEDMNGAQRLASGGSETRASADDKGSANDCR